tara:strand:+ start:1095 stop:1418 length:324 start_codon:yes stop_codon:yes gene_type:complete
MPSYFSWKDGEIWGKILSTWGDYQLVVEVAEEIGGKGSYSRRQEKLNKFLDKEPEKKKRLIHLICRIEGIKVYDGEKEVNEKTEVSVEKVEMLIKEVIGKVKVKDVV